MLQDALDSLNDVFSPPFRSVMLKSAALTVATLAAGGFAIGHFALAFVAVSGWLGTILSLALGLGLLAAAVFLVSPVVSLVASFFFDEIAARVEREADPYGPPGRPAPLVDSLSAALRFGALALLVTLAGLVLVFVPGVGFAMWFAANAWVLGAEYFELAALRFRPAPAARALRRRYAGTVFLYGLIVAGFVTVPLLNLTTPLFAAALMARLHKRLSLRLVSPPVARPSTGATG